MEPHPSEPLPLARTARWFLLLLAAGLGGLLVVARRLEPDPRGFGTHTQLGLGPCSFAMLTGRACPTCGMTTAFAWFTRGCLALSWQASPAGFLIAALCVPVIAWLLLSSWLKNPVGFRSVDRPLMGLLLSTVVVSLLFWFTRIIGAHVDLGLFGMPPVLGPR